MHFNGELTNVAPRQRSQWGCGVSCGEAGPARPPGQNKGLGLLPPMPHLQCGPHPDFQLEMSSCQRIRLSAKLLVIGWSVNSK